MISWVLIQLVALVVLLAFSAFFSSSETAFFSLDPLQIRRMEGEHPAAAKRIRNLVAKPTQLLSTLLIGNTLINVTASTLGFGLADHFFPHHGETVAVPVMTMLLLIFGEIGPKRIAMFWPERVSRIYAGVFPAAHTALTPLRILLTAVTRHVEHLFERRGQTLTEDELESVVDLSGEAGVLASDESSMVQSIMGLEDLTASDVMVPRVDVVGVDLYNPPASCKDLALNAGVRFLPLYSGNLDQVEAVLNVSRFLLDPDHILARASGEPFYVPETAPLDKVLSQFLQTGTRVAVVVDEYGGTSGLITRGDILEEITGEIDDEFAPHKPMIESVGTDRWLADGSISLEDLNEETGLSLTAEGADRLAGWIAEQIERMPRAGDVIKAQGCRAVVRQMRRNRVLLVYVEVNRD
jgi:Mg2+/Co2+ transporter CorB